MKRLLLALLFLLSFIAAVQLGTFKQQSVHSSIGSVSVNGIGSNED